MSAKSKIEWTEATWNPVTGCTKVSPACKNCYAEVFANRFKNVKGHPYEQGFKLKLWPSRLNMPLLWKKPCKIFVNSMSDLFHEDVPDQYIEKVFQTMKVAEKHIFQILTKRQERMLKWTTKRYGKGKCPWPKNIWLGVSVETDQYLNRIDLLKKTPAKTKFISFEPLLGKIDFEKNVLKGIDWVIVGGESGSNARAMKEEWVDSIYKRCKELFIPFFFKQWGTYNRKAQRVGKKKSGRIYNNKCWNEMPTLKK